MEAFNLVSACLIFYVFVTNLFLARGSIASSESLVCSTESACKSSLAKSAFSHIPRSLICKATRLSTGIITCTSCSKLGASKLIPEMSRWLRILVFWTYYLKWSMNSIELDISDFCKTLKFELIWLRALLFFFSRTLRTSSGTCRKPSSNLRLL